MKFKRFSLALIIILLITVYFSYSWIYKPLDDSEDIEMQNFEIEVGDGPNIIADNLKAADLIKNETLFKLYLKWYKLDTSLQAGSYDLSRNLSMVEIVEILQDGVVWEEQLVLQIKEGENIFEIREYIEELGFSTEDWDRLIKISAWTDQYTFFTGIDTDKTIEGFLFPDTYYFNSDNNLEDIFSKVLTHFGEKTADLRLEIKGKNLDFYDTLVLASVVEWEVRTPKNRALVADIFWRRYQDEYLLQSDATLNYYKTKEERDDRHSGDELLDENPYNTYKYAGLPPTPVNNPSLGSLEATVNPESNDYYFFLTTENGEIYYAETYDGHLENTRLYLD